MTSTQEEEDVDWNNDNQQQQHQHQHQENIDNDQFNNLQQEANHAGTTTATTTTAPSSANNNNNRRPMSVPIASLAGGALNSGNYSSQQQQQPTTTTTVKKSQQLSNNLLDSARKVTTRERQREREYKKTLMQQEKGNADVDYSNWESGNAPDAMGLRVATAVTELVRDAFANITAMRREIRQRNVDALANGSPLSEEAGRAVQEAMQESLYPLSTGLVEVLENGLRSVMPLFSSSMRNTEGLMTLAQIRDQLQLEASRDVNAAHASSSSTTATRTQQQQQQQAPSFIPLPPTTSSSSSNTNNFYSTSARKSTHHVSRLDSHPVYDREQESDNHMQQAIVSPRNNNNNNYRIVGGGGGSSMNTMTGTLSQPILTTLSQVQSKITENAEAWPADHRRHQAHSTIHQKVHPTKAEAAKRVSDAKNRMLKDHQVESIIPPVLNKLVLASLPQSARSAATSTPAGFHSSGGSTTGTTTTSIAEMKKQHKQQQQQQSNDSHHGSPNISARRKQLQYRNHEDLMARYPTNTIDGFAARILSLHDPKLSSGIWRQLSVNEKQVIISFEQNENRYHHLHGVTNMKLAGLRMKVRRSEKSGIQLSAGDYAALADAERRKKILEEQRACDVRQTALVVKSWLPPLPDRFDEEK